MREYGPVLKTEPAAAYIGSTKSSLEKGRLVGGDEYPPFVRIGRRSIGYLKSDLDAWLESRRRRSTSEAA